MLKRIILATVSVATLSTGVVVMTTSTIVTTLAAKSNPRFWLKDGVVVKPGATIKVS